MSCITVEKTYTVYIGDDREVEVYAVLVIGYEHNYGADADGNRGSDAYFLEDYSLTAGSEDFEGAPLTESDKVEACEKAKQKVKVVDVAGIYVAKDSYDKDAYADMKRQMQRDEW